MPLHVDILPLFAFSYHFEYSFKKKKKNVPEPFLIENQVRVRTVWWAMRDSNPHWSGYEPPALTVKLMALMTLFQRSVKWLSYPENTQVRFLSH